MTRDDGNKRGGGKDDERDDIVTAVEEEIDRGETTTHEMVAAVAESELEDKRRCENEADEQALLERLLQSKAKAAADCILQDQKGEMLEAGREGDAMTHEGSVPEVEQPYVVV